MPIKADKSLRAYYNEIDPFAAQWIRNLMAEGWITKGDVDERSIEDVQPNDLTGYDRLHFFAGVAVWDYALNQAGWGRGEIWTGSCPCQPFSAAGKGSGFDDERHLWPAFHHLIEQCRPAIVLGEQVASKDGLGWFDLVQADMEGADYACAAVDTCAAGFGAPHIRQRLYWVAYASDQRQHGRRPGEAGNGRDSARVEPERLCDAGGVDHTAGARHDGSVEEPEGNTWDEARLRVSGAGGGFGGLADDLLQQRPNGEPGKRSGDDPSGRVESSAAASGLCGDLRPSPTNGFWGAADWLHCRDGKWRPVEPGTFPLVNGAAARVGRSSNSGAPIDAYSGEARVMRLRGYGNAINSEAAINFVRACKESIHGIF